MTKAEKATEYFANNYNCAQSVLGAFCEDEGLELNTAFKLANGFGGGVRCGEVCGSVTGAIMVIGLKCGYYNANDLQQKAFCNRKSYEFMERFKEANGSFMCRELLGMDIRCPEDHTTPDAREAHKTICPKLVASAATLLEQMDF